MSVVGKYKMVSFKGEAVPAEFCSIEITPGEEESEFRVRIHLANSMSGVVYDTRGKLKGMLRSSMEMGPPEQMKIEAFFRQAFHMGIAPQRSGTTLKLTFRHREAVFEAV